MIEYKAVRRDEVLPEPKIQTCGLDHVALHVTDLERSRRFYIEVLGFTPYFEVEGHVFLRTGSCQVGLFEARGHDVTAYAEMDHFALQSPMSKKEILAALKAEGIELVPRPEGLGWPRGEAPRGIYFHDPDGHIVQLLPCGTWPQVEQEPEVHVTRSRL